MLISVLCVIAVRLSIRQSVRLLRHTERRVREGKGMEGKEGWERKKMDAPFSNS